MRAKEINLRRTMQINAGFSFASGLVSILWASALGNSMGIGNTLVLQIIGAALVVFAGSIILALKSIPENKFQIKVIIWQDWAWVIGAAVIISLGLLNMDSAGYWILGIISLPVALFAILQGKYLKEL